MPDVGKDLQLAYEEGFHAGYNQALSELNSYELKTIVRCKDCKHRPIKPNDYANGFDLEFPDEECPCQCDDGWYSWYPSDDWFCPYGERRESK